MNFGQTYLLSFEDLRIEVVPLGHIEVIENLLDAFVLQSAALELDVVEKLFVGLVLEVVDDGNGWRIVLEANLHRYGR